MKSKEAPHPWREFLSSRRALTPAARFGRRGSGGGRERGGGGGGRFRGSPRRRKAREIAQRLQLTRGIRSFRWTRACDPRNPSKQTLQGWCANPRHEGWRGLEREESRRVCSRLSEETLRVGLKGGLPARDLDPQLVLDAADAAYASQKREICQKRISRVRFSPSPRARVSFDSWLRTHRRSCSTSCSTRRRASSRKSRRTRSRSSRRTSRACRAARPFWNSELTVFGLPKSGVLAVAQRVSDSVDQRSRNDPPRTRPSAESAVVPKTDPAGSNRRRAMIPPPLERDEPSFSRENTCARTSRYTVSCLGRAARLLQRDRRLADGNIPSRTSSSSWSSWGKARRVCLR